MQLSRLFLVQKELCHDLSLMVTTRDHSVMDLFSTPSENLSLVPCQSTNARCATDPAPACKIIKTGKLNQMKLNCF